MMNCKEIERKLVEYISAELNEQTMAEIKVHLTNCGSCAASLEAASEIIDAVKGMEMKRMPANTEAKILHRLQSERSRKTRRFMLPWGQKFLAISAAAAIIAVAAGLLFSRPQTVTAAEVISRATRARNGLVSWHVRYKFTSPNDTRYCERWFKSPDKIRLEDIREDDILGCVIRNGAEMCYYPNRQRVSFSSGRFCVESPISEELFILEKSRLFSRKPIDEITEIGPEGQVIGVEAISGRKCDILRGKKDGYDVLMWIDRETGTVMRSIRSLRGRIVSRLDNVSIEINQDIPDAVFSFSNAAPKGAQIARAPFETWSLHTKLSKNTSLGFCGDPRDPAQAGEELRSLLHDDDGLELTEVYQPDYIPEGFSLIATSQFVDLPSGNELDHAPGHHHCWLELDYVNLRTGAMIILVQGIKDFLQHNGAETNMQTEEASQLSINGTEGKIITHYKPFAYIILNWNDGTTYFTLGTTGMRESEAIKIAESLRKLD